MRQYNKLNLIELRNLCRDNNLRVTGKKAEMIKRLEEFDQCGKNDLNEMNKRIQEMEETIVQLRESSFNETVIPISRSTPPTILVQGRENGFAPEVLPNMTTENNTNTTMTTTVPWVTHCTDVFRPQLIRGSQVSQSLPTGARQYQIPVTAYVPLSATCQVPEPNRQFLGTQPSTQATDNGQYMNVRDIVDILPDFDPLNRKYLNAKQFINRIQLLRDAYNWNDKVLLFAVQQKLKGHAKQWLDSQRSIYTSWVQFVNEFTTVFPCNENVAEVHIEMSKTKRLLTETPQAYYYKMVAIGSSGGLSDREIVTHIINGINDFDLRKKISNEYSFCTQLLHDIDVYTTYNEIRQVNTKPIRSVAVEKVPDTKIQEDSTNERKVRCYNCNKHGHFANSCPEPQKKNRKGKVAENNSTKNPNINQIGDNIAVVKQIIVNGHTTSSFIDPGSSKTLVRRSFGIKLGDVVHCHIELRRFAGGEFIATELVQVYVKMDDFNIPVKMLLVDDDLISQNVRLGRDVLCHEGRKLTIENDKCHIEPVNNVDTVKHLNS